MLKTIHPMPRQPIIPALAIVLLVLAALGACHPAGAAATAPLATPAPLALTIHPSAAQPGPDGPDFDGNLWVFGTHQGLLHYPVPVLPGDEIVSWELTLQRDQVSDLGPFSGARLERLPKGETAVEHVSMGATSTLRQVGVITLAIELDPTWKVSDDGAGYVLIVGSDGNPGDRAGDLTVRVRR